MVHDMWLMRTVDVLMTFHGAGEKYLLWWYLLCAYYALHMYLLYTYYALTMYLLHTHHLPR